MAYQQLEEDTVDLIEVLTNVKIQRVKEAERANTRNKALQSDIREMKKEMKTLVKRIKELEEKNVLVE